MKQLYYVAFKVSETRTVFKIGITGQTVQKRYSGCKTPFVPIWILYADDAEDVRSLERLVIDSFRFDRCEDTPVDGLGNSELFEVNVLPSAKDGIDFFAKAGIKATTRKPKTGASKLEGDEIDLDLNEGEFKLPIEIRFLLAGLPVNDMLKAKYGKS